MKIKKNGHRVVKASLGSAVLLSLLLGGQVFAADPIVMNGQNGTENIVKGAADSTVIGNGNTVTNSKSQVVLGDNNKVTGRNNGTVSGEQEERSKNVLDVVIGKNNDIGGNNTYMKGNESLTVLGNNNSVTNPSALIIIGDNQKVGAANESIIIGSMSLEDKADETIVQKGKSVVVGFGAQSGNQDTGGTNVAIGYYTKAVGFASTVVGNASFGDIDAAMSTIYGVANKIIAPTEGTLGDGAIANGMVGTLNKIADSNESMVFGSGNRITNAISDNSYGLGELAYSGFVNPVVVSMQAGVGYLDSDSEFLGALAAENGGSVFAIGNGNVSDYARLSQIVGSGNSLIGTLNSTSNYNTISGYKNTGTNVTNTSVIGTGNTLTGETSSVIIGDYHSLSGGNNNVILGSMATKTEEVTKTYASHIRYSDGSEVIGDPQEYKVTVTSPVVTHKANLENAVMLGYNTDVTQNGGVALGAQSVASTAEGVEGFDAKGTDHSGDTTGTWKSTLAAVSVGDAANNLTRQITGVAAGTELTDAVNVAQLKAAVDAAGTGLQRSNNALSYEDNKLSLAIKDSKGNDFITGSVEISDLAKSINTRNSVGNFDGDNTITIEKADGVNEFNGVKYQLKVNTDGKVAADNKGVVNGGTVYNETRVAKDGTYVKQSKSAADNLTALDSQVAANTTQITQNTNNITSISNEVSNITNNVTSLNSQVNKLDNRINRVGAGAAALAALHPQDYDPTAKWDFAAGYGNYKSANAVAIGAFYRPTNDLLFSVGTSMGGGENMFNAGVSIKFGKGSEYSNYSKTDLVSVISSQQAEISAVKADNEAIKADNEAKTKRIEALEKQMQEILSKINR